METTVKKYIFSFSAAERILNLPTFNVTGIEINNSKQVKVITKKKEYYVSSSKFYRHFAEIRKEKAKCLIVESTSYSNVFRIINPENNHRYPVRFTAQKIECKCRDYQKQQELLGKGCCSPWLCVARSS